MVRPHCVTKMLASRACRGSIMIGTALDKREMSKVWINKCSVVIIFYLIACSTYGRNETTLGKSSPSISPTTCNDIIVLELSSWSSNY